MMLQNPLKDPPALVVEDVKVPVLLYTDSLDDLPLKLAKDSSWMNLDLSAS